MKVIASIIFLQSLIVYIHGLQPRIFGGSDAPEGKFKYYAYLHTLRSTKNYCSGTIIHKRWILTAGHCFQYDDIRFIDVQVGTVLRSGQGGTTYNIDKRIVHENYNRPMVTNDISLLHVDRDIEFNDKVQPIRLADKNTIVSDNEIVGFVGFGRTQNGKLPPILQEVSLFVFEYDICKEIERRTTETEICTLPESNIGPCSGDSGGALVNAQGIQIGIHSHAYGEGLKTCGLIPEIYLRVSSYRNWIDTKIREN